MSIGVTITVTVTVNVTVTVTVTVTVNVTVTVTVNVIPLGLLGDKNDLMPYVDQLLPDIKEVLTLTLP